VLLWYRVLWLSVGAAILGLTYVRFSFSYAAERVSRKPVTEQPEQAILPATRELPAVRTSFTKGDSLREVLSLTKLQFNETVRSVFFAVLLLAGAIFAILSATNINNPFATPVYPVTWRMLHVG